MVHVQGASYLFKISYRSHHCYSQLESRKYYLVSWSSWKACSKPGESIIYNTNNAAYLSLCLLLIG